MKPRSGDSDGEQGQALTGKGEMAELIRTHDWSRTPIGPREKWPASLRTVVDVLTATQFPMALLWGRELILIYNDAYRVICGDKHPAALGRSTRDIWSEVWPINEPIFAAVMDRGETLSFEDKLFPIQRRGHVEDAYFTLCYSPVRTEDGRIGGVLVVLEETTERIKSGATLSASEAKYRNLFDNMSSEVHFWKLVRDERGEIKTWRLVDINPAGLKSWGRTREETIGKTADEIFPGATAHFMPIVRQIFREGRSHSWESYFPGLNQHLKMTSVPFGEYFITTGVDVTDVRKTAAALKDSEERFRVALEGSAITVFTQDADLRYTWAYNPSPGFHVEAVLGKRDEDIHSPEDAAAFTAIKRQVMASGVGRRDEVVTHRPASAGGDMVHDMTTEPLRDSSGRIIGVTCAATDITARKRMEDALTELSRSLEKKVAERAAELVSANRELANEIAAHKQAEEALRESEERYRRVFTNDMVPMGVWNRAGVIVEANDALLKLIGYSRAELEAGRIRWDEITPPEYHERDLQAVREVEQNGFCAPYEKAYRHKEGHAVPILIGAGRFDDHVGTGVLFAIDLTARKQVEVALIESEERFHLFMDNSPAIAWIKDDRGRYVYLSKSYEDRFGVRLENWRGKTDADLWPAEIAETFRRNDRAVLDARRAIEVEEETINPDGSRCYWLNSKFPFSDAAGHRYVGGIGIDITGRKRAETVSYQAQKMETVGRLAGGVAHEFNNLLQGIVGYTELSRNQVAPDHPIGAYLNAINDAAIQSATLTRRLLAFAQKQMISPAPFNLNDHVSAFLALLRGLIGERIELIWVPGRTRSTVKMDTSQIDQILANLAANSRDAMAGGGTITITTANATLDETYCTTHADAVPGDYVLLTFSDTGCGMDDTTLDRLFEPFFTTKDIGKGMGMGLAVVYGIVRQNNGHITVESRQGKGTTFHIYLPRWAGDGTPAAPSHSEPARSPTASSTDAATVLLVDDDPVILKTGYALLRALGYIVLSASSAEEALRVEEGHPGTIHLLLTDVVMPGLDGRELATRLTAKRPELGCIFMSGYPANHVARHGILEQDVAFLAKPFTRDQLARKVREVLNKGRAS